jgi:hypothetical protein
LPPAVRKASIGPATFPMLPATPPTGEMRGERGLEIMGGAHE